MNRGEVETIASKIRNVMNQKSPPVDVFQIAKEEGILLAPGDYGDEFDGRIEFHPKPCKFILFYPNIEKSKYPTRIRFSISHELGHYYLPEHRKFLIHGRFHNSKSGFVLDNELEREADYFAASLLLPENVLKEICARKKFCTLKDLIKLANIWQTSVTSAAIRYVQWASESCAVVLSRNSNVLFYLPSDDAAFRGFQWLGKQKVALRSATVNAHENQGSGNIFEQESNSEMWFSDRQASLKLWEEAFPLGYTGLVVTMLAFEVECND
jgi:hypothetical protein